MTTPTLAPGPCAPWVDAADVTNYRPDLADQDIEPDVLVTAAIAATDLLYVLSGRQFPGQCRTTVRPTAKPNTFNLSEWTTYFEMLSGSGWSASWGRCGGESHTWCRNPPQVDLGVFPIVAINNVLVDGVVIPTDEYRVDDYRLLVRVQPTINTTPTERWGWPTCQDYTLPDTQQGTFSVDVTYGMSAPAMGLTACANMAAEIALSMSGLDNQLPQRVTSVTRQGVSFAVLDAMQFLTEGKTGIYLVDLFLEAANPGGKQRRRAQVLSPDLGYSRRPTS